VSQPLGPSRDAQDIIPTRMAGEMQPVGEVSPAPSPKPSRQPSRHAEPDAATLMTSPAEAATRVTQPAVDPDATRPSDLVGPGADSGVQATVSADGRPGSSSFSRSRMTGTFTRLGRTRTNVNLPRDTQELDLRLQTSRPSVLADLGRLGPDSMPPGVKKLIDEHGTEGRYAVDKPLAQGGMGAVLLIKDGDFQRPAAMKVMLSRYAQSPEAMERFLAEAQVTAQLEHPNIVPIHDLGIMEDGTVYFTMKYIEGESLGAVVKRLRSDDAAVAARAVG
jgi:hypothetical protein